jgi:hypothetical protein
MKHPLVRVGFLALALATPCAARGDAPQILGQVAMNDLKLDGALVPAGTAVLSPSSLTTDQHPSVVHLRTGQTLALDSNSSADLQAMPDGTLHVIGRSGRVQIADSRGEVMTLASRDVAVLATQEPAAGGPRVRLLMCKPNGQQLEVNMTKPEVQAAMSSGWVPAGVDPYGPNCENRPGVAGWSTPGRRIAIAAGVGVLGFVISDQTRGENNVNVSCVPGSVPVASRSGLPVCPGT